MAWLLSLKTSISLNWAGRAFMKKEKEKKRRKEKKLFVVNS